METDIFTPKQEDLSYVQALGESENVSENCEDIDCSVLLQNKSSIAIKRREILDFKDEGFLLSGVLSPGECTYLIEQGDRTGFKLMHGVKKEYRNSTRIMVQSDDLASVLWERIRPHLKDIEITGDPHNVHIHGVETLLKGKWQPLKLNNLFRLCKYEPGGHFAPHYDGHLVESSQVRSLVTLMLYLNSDFDKGCTNFVDDSQALYMDKEGKYCAEEKNILCGIKPEPGLAMLFHHHRLHEGEAVRNGVKYILRTDVMYRRVEGEALDPREEEALQIVQEAERLEASGEEMKAMELYRKAFKMSPSVAKSYGS